MPCCCIKNFQKLVEIMINFEYAVHILKQKYCIIICYCLCFLILFCSNSMRILMLIPFNFVHIWFFNWPCFVSFFEIFLCIKFVVILLNLLRKLPSPCLRVGSSPGGRSRFPQPALSLSRLYGSSERSPDELVSVCVCV